jgi:ubiquinone/menaquinone biosynthesis C-methylase UbiE
MTAMESAPRLAPGIPGDYYTRIHRFEQDHFWYRRMREMVPAFIGNRLLEPGVEVLDAGCGTGGFLRWVLDANPSASVAGVDVGADAIDLARARVPEAELEALPVRSLPFSDERFDVVVTKDVLQHVDENDVELSLREMYRVLKPGGVLFLHTNGSRHLRRERHDWRAYDIPTVRRELESVGFRCERITHANCALSAWASLRGRPPHAPTETTDGVPLRNPSRFVSTVGDFVLGMEVRWLRRPKATLPFGHTILCRASKPIDDGIAAVPAGVEA